MTKELEKIESSLPKSLRSPVLMDLSKVEVTFVEDEYSDEALFVLCPPSELSPSGWLFKQADPRLSE